MPDLIAKKFLPDNNKGSLTTTLKEIIEFVNNHIPGNLSYESIMFRVKVIVTELLNNAIKHVKNSETTIYVLIDGENIILKKTDSGDPFGLNNGFLLINSPRGTKVQICGDALHCVYALFENEYQIKFCCEDKLTDNMTDLNVLMEHFGLLIITKAADIFTYEYDVPTGLNTFSASIRLNKL